MIGYSTLDAGNLRLRKKGLIRNVSWDVFYCEVIS